MRPRLVDWSRYNGKTDLQATIDEWGIIGLLARCTIGHAYVDTYYRHNFIQARDRGVLFGAYHVTRPQDRAAAAEVKHFKDNVRVDGELPDFTVADSELPNTPDGWKLITPQDAGKVLTATFFGIRDAIPLTMFDYTGSWWWDSKDHLGPATPLGIGDDFMLIEAEYTTGKADWGKVDFAQAPEEPRVPRPGKDWPIDRVVGWQWTDGLKPIGNGPDGINRMDGDVLLVTLDRFLEIIGKKPHLTDKQKLEILWTKHPEFHPEVPA